MYCIFSKEAIKLMNGNRGKLASMAGHAYLHTYWDAEAKGWELRYNKDSNFAGLYKNGGLAKKVTVFVDTTEELLELFEQVKTDTHSAIGCSLVKDAGLTVFDGPTVVCFGYGPIPDDKVPEAIANLKVLI
jgi:peptidyl-tRNA hydrolase